MPATNCSLGFPGKVAELGAWLWRLPSVSCYLSTCDVDQDCLSMDHSFNVFQFRKMFPLGGTFSQTPKALRVPESLFVGWVHQLVLVDGAASRRETQELLKWRPSYLTECSFPPAHL